MDSSALLAWGRRVSSAYGLNRASLAAGGLAYFVALSIAPMAIAFGALAGLILKPEQLRDALEALVDRAPASAGVLNSGVQSVIGLVQSASASTFTIATVVGILVALYAASKVVLGLRFSLDSVFGLQGYRSGIVMRAFSALAALIGMVISVVLVVLVTALPQVLQWLGITDVSATTGSWILDWLIIFALVFLAVRGILRFVPGRRDPVPWNSLGVVVAAVWILLSTAMVGVYAGLSSTMGATVALLGSAIVGLVWLYLCFIGLLLGATIEADRRVQLRRDSRSREVSSADSQGMDTVQG